MINVEKVTKRFDDFTALNEISCTIREGCIYGMVGSNGAGKSTLLRLISGVYRPDAGRITIEGQPVWENPEIKQQMVYIPDDLYFLPGASIRRMEMLYARAYPQFDHERCRRLVETFRLDPQKPVAAFSKGMRRQAACILAISCRPQYLFFDETFDGLDPVMRRLVKNLICRDVLEQQATAIITSHSLRELEDTCDQLALLHKGGLVLESDVQKLKTTLFKVQIAFDHAYDHTVFSGFDVLNFTKHGSVSNLIVRGDREAVTQALRTKSPVLLEVLPLSLEEVFLYEMESLGYAFDDEIR